MISAMCHIRGAQLVTPAISDHVDFYVWHPPEKQTFALTVLSEIDAKHRLECLCLDILFTYRNIPF